MKTPAMHCPLVDGKQNRASIIRLVRFKIFGEVQLLLMKSSELRETQKQPRPAPRHLSNHGNSDNSCQLGHPTLLTYSWDLGQL